MVVCIKAYMLISERHVVFIISLGKRHIMGIKLHGGFFFFFFIIFFFNLRITLGFNKRWT